MDRKKISFNLGFSGQKNRPPVRDMDVDFSTRDYRTVAPPSNYNKRPGHHHHHDVNQVHHKKKKQLDDDYFNDDEEEEDAGTSYNISKPGGGGEEVEDEEEDPLDAFMAGLTETKETTNDDTKKTKKKKEQEGKLKGVRGDIEEEDNEESYYRYMEENPMAGINGDEAEYDEEGNLITNPLQSSKYIDPLPAIDHGTIKYEPFNKNFYSPHQEIVKLTESGVADLRKKLGIKVFGSDAPSPVCSFGHFNFDDQLMRSIRKAEFTTPTPIQAQGIPIALSGRDIIGVAKTGSGKTAAYLWPLIVHVMDQRNLKLGDGPIGLILAPTRELAQQIYTDARKFSKVYNINVVCAYGGGNKWEQVKDLEGGAEIVVATPGRMIDLIKLKCTNLQRVTCLILDEADRMFDLGFEPQVRSICNHVRCDRQTLLFSATFKKRIEMLARDVLNDPIKIVQGESGGEANEDIEQQVLLFNDPAQKWSWLNDNLVQFLSSGSVMIFVTRKANSEELATNLREKNPDLNVLLIHGDLDQADRNKTIMAFKRKESPILVATDVASRGLDIPHIRTVINYDVARDVDTHTHRIGRTGRAGEKGFAYTLITEKDKEFSGHLVRSLESGGQEVPQYLIDLAMKSTWFKNSRYKQTRATKASFKDRRRPPQGGMGGPRSNSNMVPVAGTSSTSSSSSSNFHHRTSPSVNRLITEQIRDEYKKSFHKASQ